MSQLKNYKYIQVWEYKGLDMDVSFYQIIIVYYVILKIHNLIIKVIYVLNKLKLQIKIVK